MKKYSIIVLVLFPIFTYFLGECQARNIFETIVAEQELIADDAQSPDKFGKSVAISGDFAVVGAYGDSDNGRLSGSSYIFSRSANGWIQRQKLIASDGASLDQFGYSVSISGNFVLVGAFGDNCNGDYSGSAYVFYFNGTNWSQMQKLTASDGSSWDKFGSSVAISGNFALVGAHGDNDNGESSGSSYVFRFDGTSWHEIQKLTPSDGSAGKNFGNSVAISNDYAIVGASGDGDAGGLAGSAYIFHNNSGNWTELQKLTASDGTNWDKFGQSVSISNLSAAIGAPGDDDKGDSSGSVYMYRFNGTSWLQEQKITATDGASADYFGNSVGVSGDYLIVGADGNDDLGLSSGSAYIFHFAGAVWSEAQKITSKVGATYDYFGQSVGIEGMYAIVGAHGDDDMGESSGVAYMYSGVAPNVVVLPEFIATPSTDTDLVITFDASRSQCYEIVDGVNENRLCAYAWDFGSAGRILGGTGTDIVVYQYNEAGVYNVNLTLTESSSGTEGTASLPVTAEIVVPQTPFADFATSVNGKRVTLTAISLPANVTRAYIYWGDRTRSLSLTPQVDLLSGGVWHDYNLRGRTYNLRVMTIDADYNKVNYTINEDGDLSVAIP